MRKPLIILLLVIICQAISATKSSPILVENQALTVTTVGAQDYDVSNNGELRISSPNTTSTGIINITSETAWVKLDGVLPSQAIASYLSKFRVNGQTAINKTNIRVSNYLRGCIIMPHGISYQPLTVYKDENYLGEQLKLSQNTYHQKAQLGTFDDAISSFKLKKGYMATFAFNEDGTRFSKVYVADNADVNIPVLPTGLNNQVSFVRVLPWRYSGKKGIGYGTIEGVKAVKSDWYYSWGPKSIADLTDIEFVPMKWNAKSVNDANWADILAHQDVTHVLGFNEPDQAEQANMTVDKQIELWPKMMESGLRLGAPAFAGNYTQLYEFIDRCDALNYRVDFIPIHLYLDATSQTFYNKCKEVYDRTKRPIWITEFNYGGDWSSTKPTDAAVATRIAEVIQRFDTARIVERYAIFDFHNESYPYRYVFTLPKTSYITTPMGSLYRDNVAPMAYKSAYDVIKPYKLIPPTNIKALLEGAKIVKLSWINDVETQLVTIERAPFGTTNYQVIASLSGDIVNYTDKVPYNGTFIYRFRAKNTANELSSYINLQVEVKEFINVVLNKNAVANSTLSASYAASNAVDGDTISDGNRWVNVRGVFPSHLTVGLSSRYSINELKLYTGYQGYNTPITNFDFQYWDGSAWINIVSETNNTNSRYTKKFTAVQTDSVRLFVNGVYDTSTAGGIIRLFEMQVMGALALNTITNNAIELNNKLKIFPNPSTGIINILIADNAQFVEVFNVSGMCLYKSKITSQIDLSFLNKGFYFLKTDTNQTAKISIK